MFVCKAKRGLHTVKDTSLHIHVGWQVHTSHVRFRETPNLRLKSGDIPGQKCRMKPRTRRVHDPSTFRTFEAHRTYHRARSVHWNAVLGLRPDPTFLDLPPYIQNVGFRVGRLQLTRQPTCAEPTSIATWFLAQAVRCTAALFAPRFQAAFPERNSQSGVPRAAFPEPR